MDGLVASGVHFMRHYVHAECTPTRVSFQTGRLPMHSGQPGLCSPTKASCGIPYDATCIASKLARAGYHTAFVGKWYTLRNRIVRKGGGCLIHCAIVRDCGMATQRHTPAGRGYHTALNYFGHGNYQWGQIEWGANGGGRAGNTKPPSDPKGDNASLPRDLWDFDKPATALSDVSRDEGVYEEDLFHQRMHTVLLEHAKDDPTKPLFLTYAARIAHYPIQAPIAYQKLPNIAPIDVPHRLVYHAQIEYLDSQLGNLTAAYKQLGLWEKTLMVLTSDNGGYTRSLGPCSAEDPIMGVTCMTGEAGASNYPMREYSDRLPPPSPSPSLPRSVWGAAYAWVVANTGAGKYSFFEGGIRANSFAAGGFLPSAVRGTVLHGVMHIADWYATYCTLADIDPTDTVGERAGLPPIDSQNMWPMLSGANLTSPRAELFMNAANAKGGGCLIQGDWKLLTGMISSASWPGPTYPNASSINNTLDQYTASCGGVGPPPPQLPEGCDTAAFLKLCPDTNKASCLACAHAHNKVPTIHTCTGVGIWPAICSGSYGPPLANRGCLYNVGQNGDWTEHEDLAAQYPEIRDKMMARLNVLSQGFWDPDPQNKSAGYLATCQDAKTVQTQKWGNFYGPFCEL